MQLSALIDSKSIVIPLKATSKKEAIYELIECLCAAHKLDIEQKEEAFQVVWKREQIMSTGIGFGVAVPHGISSIINDVIVSTGISDSFISFNGLNRQLVNIIFLVLIPKGYVTKHLGTLRAISKFATNKNYRTSLLECKTPEQVLALMRRFDAENS